jgi:DNA-binding NarL/FixJ family response regulator
MNPVWGFSKDAALLERWRSLLAGQQRSLVVDGKPSSDAVVLFDLGAEIGIDQGFAQTLVTQPGYRWVAMTARPEAAEGLRWLRAGVVGYCNRLASAEVLEAVIETAERGAVWAGQEVTDHLLALALSREVPAGSAAEASGDLSASLTPRELAIARQVADGHSNKVIAIDSGISERTVKAHLNAIFRKTGIRNRVQLALAMAAEADPPRHRFSA